MTVYLKLLNEPRTASWWWSSSIVQIDRSVDDVAAWRPRDHIYSQPTVLILPSSSTAGVSSDASVQQQFCSAAQHKCVIHWVSGVGWCCHTNFVLHQFLSIEEVYLSEVLGELCNNPTCQFLDSKQLTKPEQLSHFPAPFFFVHLEHCMIFQNRFTRFLRPIEVILHIAAMPNCLKMYAFLTLFT